MVNKAEIDDLHAGTAHENTRGDQALSENYLEQKAILSDARNKAEEL